MPLTFPAHQAIVVPLKQRFPARFDGLALVVGAGSPDLLFGLGVNWWDAHRPTMLPILVPLVVAYCWLLRRTALPGLFRHTPRLGRADLRVYGAMHVGRPGLVRSAISATVGVLSHQAWDSITHSGHPVASALGLDAVLLAGGIGPVGDDITVAKLFQYASHSLGSLVTLALLVAIAWRRPSGVLDWAEAERLTTVPRPRPAIAVVGLGLFTAAGIAVWPTVGGRGPFVLIVLWAAAAVVVGAAVEWSTRRRAGSGIPGPSQPFG